MSDEWWTDQGLYERLCKEANIYPQFDVAATSENRKCKYYFTKENDAITQDWVLKDVPTNTTNKKPIITKVPIWLNAPNTLQKEFTIKAYQQWRKFGLRILQILPAQSFATTYFRDTMWEAYKARQNIEIEPILPRPKFLDDGKESKFPSRNSYIVVRLYPT